MMRRAHHESPGHWGRVTTLIIAAWTGLAK
jgi:hypothetical protein